MKNTDNRVVSVNSNLNMGVGFLKVSSYRLVPLLFKGASDRYRAKNENKSRFNLIRLIGVHNPPQNHRHSSSQLTIIQTIEKIGACARDPRQYSFIPIGY